MALVVKNGIMKLYKMTSFICEGAVVQGSSHIP